MERKADLAWLWRRTSKHLGKGKGQETPTLVINAIPQRHIETVVTPALCTNFIHVTWPRKDRRVTTALRLQRCRKARSGLG